MSITIAENREVMITESPETGGTGMVTTPKVQAD